MLAMMYRRVGDPRPSPTCCGTAPRSPTPTRSGSRYWSCRAPTTPGSSRPRRSRSWPRWRRRACRTTTCSSPTRGTGWPSRRTGRLLRPGRALPRGAPRWAGAGGDADQDPWRAAHGAGVDLMRVLVTGARGKVGRAAATCLRRAATASRPATSRAGLRGCGPGRDGLAALRYLGPTSPTPGARLRRSCAGRRRRPRGGDPRPRPDLPHIVFANNLMATFNVVEAWRASGVRRLVHVSSETVPGFFFPERPFLPAYCPVDEEHPAPRRTRTRWPSSSASSCGRASRPATSPPSRSARPGCSGRATPSATSGPMLRDPAMPERHVLVLRRRLRPRRAPGAGGRGATSRARGRLRRAARQHRRPRPRRRVAEHYPGVPVRPLERPDASGISIAKARRLLGWDPRRSWRDYLDADGARPCRSRRRAALARPVRP